VDRGGVSFRPTSAGNYEDNDLLITKDVHLDAPFVVWRNQLCVIGGLHPCNGFGDSRRHGSACTLIDSIEVYDGKPHPLPTQPYMVTDHANHTYEPWRAGALTKAANPATKKVREEEQWLSNVIPPTQKAHTSGAACVYDGNNAS
jgi:hypothetical protein